MARLPQNAILWRDRADIDYIGPFVKAWAAFNAWFRVESGTKRDRDGLEFIKNRANPVRSAILPLLRSRENGPDGRPRALDEASQELRLLIADLHRRLEQFQIEVAGENDVLERITFTSVAIRQRVQLPQRTNSRGINYVVNKVSGNWSSTVANRAGAISANIIQVDYNEEELIIHPQYAALSSTMKGHLRGLYQYCCPRPLSNLLSGGGDPISTGDFEFRCSNEELFFGVIEVIYSLRNSLFHGELQPDERAFRAYEPAYRIVMRLLSFVQ